MRGSNAVLLRGPSNQTNAQEEIKRVTTTPTNMTTANSSHDYALGYTNSEHERLIRQAARIAPYTERLFREAGIGPGQRVLDLGSGVGDVSMLLARIVGPSGEVVGIERDAYSIARANARVAEAGLRNISFTEADVNQIVSDQLFDAAVGRFILMFLPDPASVLRSLTRLVRPGGVLAFQEPTWIPLLAFGARLPLWSKLLHAIHETFLRSGVNPEMGPDLYQVFQEVGLPAPAMHTETPLGSDANFTSLICDLFGSIRPLIQQHNVSPEALGNLDTLSDRIQAEVVASNTVVSFVPMVGVWSRKPMST
jgi:ubiquinone/menaquinone biosynthesis C-methylase UbiE